MQAQYYTELFQYSFVLFHLKSHNWEDDDLPLTYSFGYYTIDDEKSILQIQSSNNFGNFSFPSYYTVNNTIASIITCYVDVWDRYNVGTTITSNFEIYPLKLLIFLDQNL